MLTILLGCGWERELFFLTTSSHVLYSVIYPIYFWTSWFWAHQKLKHYQAEIPHCFHQWECSTPALSWCQYLCHEWLVQLNVTSNYQRPVLFLEEDYWLESLWGCLKWSTEGANGKRGKISSSIAAFLLKPQCKISSMCLALLGLGE